jgi:FAD-dependent urate hydroxylase
MKDKSLSVAANPALIPPEHPNARERIADLESRTRRAVAYLGEETPNWVPQTPEIDHDVLIVGGGQTGLALNFALRRAGITNVSVIDAVPEGFEGIWLTCARMETLRSSKTLPGPELGLESLTFRSWYEARFGEEAFEKLDRCERTLWADYVKWYRQTLDITVRNGVTLKRIIPLERGFEVELVQSDKKFRERTRKIVLATGMIGSGEPSTPPVIASLPRTYWVHTDDIFDSEIFRGQTVGVLGAASSAFDVAAIALEFGAREVHLFARHAQLVHTTRLKGLSYAGALEHFPELPDADKWHLMRYIWARSAGPIADTVLRATRFENFHLHLSSNWHSSAIVNDRVTIDTDTGRFEFDKIVAGTGYRVNLAARPELTGIIDDIALWRDRFTPPEDEESETLGSYPYLGTGFEFMEKTPGTAPYLADIHCMSNAAMLSLGRAVGEITSIRYGVPRLANRLGQDLFLADRQHHIERIKSFNRPDLTGEEYADAARRRQSESASDRGNNDKQYEVAKK